MEDLICENREPEKDIWLAPNESMLPDLIVCGAMKSGTTSFHRILENHPKIFFAEDELHFFSMDDIVEHPNFQHYWRRKWFWQDISQDPKHAWNWYASQFHEAKPWQLKCEDTTTYFSSRRAIERIALQKKPVKLIVLLRNPVDRTYSDHWHRLRTGRAVHNFEKTVLQEPNKIVRRSRYYDHMRKIRDCIPEERVRVYLFEDFVKDPAYVVRDVCDFLGIDYEDFPVDALTIHQNKTRVPRSTRLQLVLNKLLSSRVNYNYMRFLPFHSELHDGFSSLWSRVIKKISKVLNPMVKKKPPEIHLETRRFLSSYFKRELNGIDELTSTEALSTWFPEEGDKS